MVSTGSFRPWDVWWAEFDPRIGREQAGRRPAVIVGSRLACDLPNGLVIVAPMTSTDRGLPFHPVVQLDGRQGVVMTDQIKAISTRRLANKHRAQLSGAEIDSIRFAMRQMLDL